MKGYKVLKVSRTGGLVSPYAGRKYPARVLQWTPKREYISICVSGWHIWTTLARAKQCIGEFAYTPRDKRKYRIYKAETKGRVQGDYWGNLRDSEKVTAQYMRLLKRVL